MNRRVVCEDGSLYALQANDKFNNVKRRLIASKGRYAMFDGICEDPLEYIAFIQRHGGRLYKSNRTFVPCYGDGSGEGFCDFHGNGPNIAPFFYRIYDKSLLEDIKKRQRRYQSMKYEKSEEY